MNKVEELVELLDDKVLSSLNDAEKKAQIKKLVRDLKDPFRRPIRHG